MDHLSFKTGSHSDGPDKVDMSLDDIIRLNKKQRRSLKVLQSKQTGRSVPGRRAGPQLNGGGVTKAFRRRGQGVITGLAARRAALLKGVGLGVMQKARPRRRQTLAQAQGRPQAQAHAQRAPGGTPDGPFRLRNEWSAPPAGEARREARQATFLSRRGIEVRARVQKNTPAQRAPRTRPWRTPTSSSGILKVSIENPSARTQPEPAHSWSLNPPAAAAPPAVSPAPELERKQPKGVALQFDINSVGKQHTSMTLNERFRILKQKRVVAAQRNSRGGRFVTVG